MTAVAGLISDGRVWMGADSAAVGSDHSLCVRKDPKLVKIRPEWCSKNPEQNDEFLIGYSGSFRLIQILSYYLHPEQPKEKQDSLEYMVRTFVPAVATAIEAHAFDDDDWRFLVGWRGRLYLIEADFSVVEPHDAFYACGCGIDVVLGSLHTTQTLRWTPKRRITIALEAAEKFSGGVRGPFVIQNV